MATSSYVNHKPRSVAAVCAELIRRAVDARRDAGLSGSEYRRQRCLELARAYEAKTRTLAQGYLPGLPVNDP